MTRRLYRLLITLHPPRFRHRFGDEMLSIFDETPSAGTIRLLVDALISLSRQWTLRTGCWKMPAALVGALIQLAVAGVVWREAAQGLFATTTLLRNSPQTGMFLLLVAGLLTAILMGLTLLAIWMGRLTNRKPGRRMNAAALIGIGILFVPGARSQTARPSFETASVKLNSTACANGRGGGGRGAPPPGRLSVTCITIQDLIQAAYGTFANGPNMNPRLLQVVGAPAWVESDNYNIEAKPANSAASLDQLYGPMLQVLLEDRFQLKIHREARELPVYSLTVATRGPKLQPSKEGSCTPIDPNHMPPQPAPGQPPPAFCGRSSFKRNGATMTVDSFGASMAAFAGVTLSSRLNLDRPVVDKTGLPGIFDIHLEFAPDAAMDGPSIFTALQDQLGLKLSSDKAPVDVLIVDHVERPSGN